ncbi:MAG: hypothetical protein NUW01_09170 [Gemmatimonadaceae bacterium]|nr:hypothetical protein [Gemmatimonadaceae bacterium]
MMRLFAFLLVLGAAACHARPLAESNPAPAPPAPRAQNPSPMVETTRRHERVPQGQPPGVVFRIDSVLPRPVDVFIPDKLPVSAGTTEERTLLVHVFSAAYVPMHAVANAQDRYVLAVVNLGGSSSAYERALSDTAAWNTLIQRVRDETVARTQGRVRVGRVVVSAFSAGYGGVRALLSNERTAATIDGVLLLDGLHTSYIPERTVLAEGGALDTLKLVPFLRYARRAVAGEVRFVITHSEIFPGTFASTTETADWIIAALGLARTPVLEWGPGGMQQLSAVRRGGLAILGFAGNTGPDHIDHLHGLGGFLPLLSASASPASTPSTRSNR